MSEENYSKEEVTETFEENANDVSDPMVNRARLSNEVQRKNTLESENKSDKSLTPIQKKEE